MSEAIFKVSTDHLNLKMDAFMNIMKEYFKEFDPESKLKVRRIKSEYDRIENYLIQGDDFHVPPDWFDAALSGLAKKLYDDTIQVAFDSGALNKEVISALKHRFDWDDHVIIGELGEFLIKKATYG